MLHIRRGTYSVAYTAWHIRREGSTQHESNFSWGHVLQGRVEARKMIIIIINFSVYWHANYFWWQTSLNHTQLHTMIIIYGCCSKRIAKSIIALFYPEFLWCSTYSLHTCYLQSIPRRFNPIWYFSMYVCLSVTVTVSRQPLNLLFWNLTWCFEVKDS